MTHYKLMYCLVTALCLISFDSPVSQEVPPKKKAASKETSKDKLCVTIWPKTTLVQRGNPFLVDLRVVNATEDVLSIQLKNWGLQWETDSTRISLYWHPPFSGRIWTVVLKPGEAYERTAQLMVNDGPPTKIISFRMAFTPDDFLIHIPIPPLPKPDRPKGARGEEAPPKEPAAPPKRKIEIYWSNRVVLGVIPNNKEKSNGSGKEGKKKRRKEKGNEIRGKGEEKSAMLQRDERVITDGERHRPKRLN